MTRRWAAPAEKIPAGPLPAAHGQHHRFGLGNQQAVLAADRGYRQGFPLALQVHHGGAEQVGDGQLLGPPDKPGGVLRAGKLLLKGVQAKAVVDALVQDAPQLLFPLQNQHILHPGLPGGNGGSQARRAAADYHNIVGNAFLHSGFLLPGFFHHNLRMNAAFSDFREILSQLSG